MRIEDLVSMDMQGDFRSDVQLSDYETLDLNHDLLKNYIFTVHAPTAHSAKQRSFSAKDVLDQLKGLFAFSGENRIALIANYGHGKSHLALVLANFFARPAQSDEVRTILGRLDQGLNNASQVAGYRDFKNSKGEFLVVRLQGDALSDLQSGFIRALEMAISEHEATRDLELPFWYHHAEKWLKELNSEGRRAAEAYLATQNNDLPSLIADLRRQGAYELVREVFKQVTGAYPDFGREVSLEELVVWAVDDVCIRHNLGGLLILFDEFSLFLQKYMAARTAGKLQELLNGVSKKQGKCVFLAFSQQDMDSIVETYAQGPRREDVRKELERLPTDKRIRLYSLMEGVLGSYLKQSDTTWQTLYAHRPARASLTQAREITLNLFSKRYSEELRWNPEAIEQKVVKGCFPLHSLTTAILSVHDFESGAGENPRTALQFVRRMWQDLRQQPAQLPNGRPNYVLAISIVDFFGEQVSKTWYAAYRNALETSPIPLTEDHRNVLKALLLQQAVAMLDRLKLRRGNQLELLYQLCGLDTERVKDILRELSEARVIQYDPYNKISSLLPASTRPQEVESVIQEAIKNTPINQGLMDTIIAELPTPITSFEFGHASDWSPRQIALTAEMFTDKEIQKILQPYRRGVNGIEEGSRGLVVWLVAQSEEEKLQFLQTAQGILDSVLQNISHPLPVIIMLPKQATPGLLVATQRYKALTALSTTAREKIGSVMYQQESALAETNFKKAVEEWVGGKNNYTDIQRNLGDYVLPAAYRASVQAFRDTSLKTVVTECYRQSYAFRVEFYDKPVGGKGVNHLRTAVQHVSRWLFNDTAESSIRNLRTKDMLYQLPTHYLTQKWGLLTANSYTIQRPTLRALQQAWDLLETTFPPGCDDICVHPVLLTLLNPPYGHDYNTLTLLLAAWIGYHRHEIRLSLSGKMVTLSKLESIFDESKKPQDFINILSITSPLAISRTNPDEIFAQVNGLLEQIRLGNPFTVAQSQEALIELEESQEHPGLPEIKRDEIQQLRQRLEEAWRNTQEYDQRVSRWLAQLATGDFDTLLHIRNDINDLPAVSLVYAAQPPLEDLQKSWEKAVAKALETFVDRYTTLNELADYKAHENQLKRAQKALQGYPLLAQQVDTALQKLSQQRVELQKQEGEKSTIAEVNGMTSSAGLSVLYEYRKRLSALKGLSSQTANLRDSKLTQIETRIQQYEQIVAKLPEAIEQSTDVGDLRKQRDLLLRNLEQVQGTPLHQSLLDAQQRIEHLEEFFEKLRALDLLPRRTPVELTAIEIQLTDLETQFSEWLTPAQMALLEKTKQEINSIHHQETEKAQAWLADLAQRYKNSENPESLLRRIEAPPQFLPAQDSARLEQLRQPLQRRLNENVLLQIESLFQKITNPDTRRQCLNRLHELMGE